MPRIFPNLESLQTTGAPVEQSTYAYREVTIARLKNLKSLNHTTITPMARTNAELTLLSIIARQLSSEPGTCKAKVMFLDIHTKTPASEYLV